MISFAGQIVYGRYSSAPVGWLLCNGQSVTSAEFPNLASALGQSGTFSLPSMTNRFAMGGTSGIGSTGGSSSVTLSSSNLPSHSHSHSHALANTNHTHPFSGSSHSHGFTGGSHGHSFTGGSHGHFINNGSNLVRTGGSGAGLDFTPGGSTVTVSASNTTTGGSVGSASTGGTVNSASTSGTVSNGFLASGATDTDATTSGSGNSFSIDPPYIVCLAIIKT